MQRSLLTVTLNYPTTPGLIARMRSNEWTGRRPMVPRITYASRMARTMRVNSGGCAL
jgi:hypothetical protein